MFDLNVLKTVWEPEDQIEASDLNAMGLAADFIENNVSLHGVPRVNGQHTNYHIDHTTYTVNGPRRLIVAALKIQEEYVSDPNISINGTIHHFDENGEPHPLFGVYDGEIWIEAYQLKGIILYFEPLEAAQEGGGNFHKTNWSAGDGITANDINRLIEAAELYTGVGSFEQRLVAGDKLDTDIMNFISNGLFWPIYYMREGVNRW